MRPLPGCSPWAFGVPARGRPPLRARLPHPHSLRGKLTLTNVVLLAIGLVLAGAVSLAGMYQVLLGEMDSSLRAERRTLSAGSFTEESLGTLCGLAERMQRMTGDPTGANAFSQDPFLLVDPEGRISSACSTSQGARNEDRQHLAEAVHDPAGLAASGGTATVNTGSHHYRVMAVRLHDGSIIVTGMDLRGVRNAVKKLFFVELLVAVSLLGLLAVLSLMGAGRKLRPLEDMVETASAIAEGDLSRRIGWDGDSSEVAQLRNALNAMLHQIETAFQTRERATAQLHQFVADASHELRTPIASIGGYLQLYEKGILDPDEERRALGRVAAEAGRMGHLVDELLVLARLDQRPPTRPTGTVDLAALARDGAADLGVLQPERPVRLVVPECAEVPGEEAELRKVVANLLSNVRTHTPARAPVTVEVAARRDAVVLRVADGGPGMRPQDAARVFDRFFRADPDRARVTGGSGLGMSIVQAVVAGHGGTVDLVTAPGEGLAVEVRLPLRCPQDAGGGRAPAAGGGPAGALPAEVPGGGSGPGSGAGPAAGGPREAGQARGEARVTTVMSGGAPTRTGGPQKPAPRVT